MSPCRKGISGFSFRACSSIPSERSSPKTGSSAPVRLVTSTFYHSTTRRNLRRIPIR